MQLLFISNEQQTDELWGQPFPFEGWHIPIAKEPTLELLQSTDLCIDLSFEEAVHRIDLYKTAGKPVMINSCIYTLEELHITKEPVLRFNHWPSFQQRVKLEIAVQESSLPVFESFFQQWKIDVEKTADVPGFVSARIISMIINEAYLALEEQVSTRAEIDTAMKLGTNYPKGPFEWCAAIGAAKVYSLLEKLAIAQPRYSPAALLKQKAHEQ
jgi:3-hydroxybutyryl-CoA dehydrogenase